MAILLLALKTIVLVQSQIQRMMVSSFSDTILIPCKMSDESIQISDLPNDLQILAGIKILPKSNSFKQTDIYQDLALDGKNLDIYFIRKVSNIGDNNEIEDIKCDLEEFWIDFQGLESLFFTDNQNQYGSILYLLYCDQVNMQNSSQFLNNSAFNGSVFYSKNNSNLYINDTNFYYNTGNNLGGSLSISQSHQIEIENCYFLGNEAQYGAVFFIEQVNQILIQNNIIEQNFADIYGGISLFLQVSDAIIKQNTFMFNEASYAGCFFFLLTNNIQFQKNNFEQNRAILSGSAILSYLDKFLVVDDCKFKQNLSGNQGGGALFYYASSHLEVKNSVFLENYHEFSGAAFYILLSKNFTCENSRFIGNQVSNEQGGAVLIEKQNNEIKIKNSQFINNYAAYGGAMTILTEQDITQVINCTFTNNSGYFEGGALFFEHSLAWVLDSVFQNNSAKIGGSISIKQGINIKLQNLYINDNKAEMANSIYARDSEDLNFFFLNITGQFSQEYSQIYLLNNKNTYIKYSNFSNNVCERDGGVIYIQKCENIFIEDSTFENNLAGYKQNFDTSFVGGAIYAVLLQNLYLNKAIFLKNNVYYNGGAIALFKVNNLTISESFFQSNYVFFDRSQQRKQKTGDYNLSKGGVIYYETPNEEEAENIEQLNFSINISQSLFKNNSGSSGSSLYIKQNIIQERDYKINFTFKNVIIQEDMTDVGGIRIMSNQDYNKNLFDEVINQDSIIFVGKDIVQQGYVVNEQTVIKDKLEFSLCPLGTYLANGGENYCDICQQNGECDGGYGYYYPQDGYWRYNQTSTEYIQCENAPKNCLQNDTCYEGFTGVLCEQCDYSNGFFESVSGECTECPSKYVSFIYILLTFFLFLGVLALTVFFLQDKVRQVNQKKEIYVIWKKNIIYENNSTSIFKIGLLHFQIIYLLDPVNIEFPQVFTGLSKYLSGILEYSIQFLVCRSIGDIQYTLADINLKCESDYYNKYVQPINIVSLLVFIFIIPLFMLFKMYKSRHHNNKIKNQCSYGYLYIDLKKDLYYWEFLSMFQDSKNELNKNTIHYFCLIIVFITNGLFIVYGVFIYYPNMKFKILSYTLTYFKKCFGIRLQKYFDNQEIIKKRWKIIRDSVKKYGMIINQQKYKNINRAFLFQNINSVDIIEGIKKGDFKKVNQKVLENYESRIFSQKSISINKAKNYVDMIKSMNSLSSIPQQVQSNKSLKNIFLGKQNLQYNISVLEEELKSGESGENKQKNSNSSSGGSQSLVIQSDKKISEQIKQDLNKSFDDNILYNNNKNQYKQQQFQEISLDRKVENQQYFKNQENKDSFIQINDSQISASNIPQETNQKISYDNLDQKWMQFNSQSKLTEQKQNAQFYTQYQKSSGIIQNQFYLKQKNQEVQNDNIFSNPSDRAQRAKNQKIKMLTSFELQNFTQQTSTENFINLLSLDSGQNLQERIIKNCLKMESNSQKNMESSIKFKNTKLNSKDQKKKEKGEYNDKKYIFEKNQNLKHKQLFQSEKNLCEQQFPIIQTIKNSNVRRNSKNSSDGSGKEIPSEILSDYSKSCNQIADIEADNNNKNNNKNENKIN
ncbi:Pectin lyase fold/virulence factor [Pseudocohnilembus persalinus]|uniref:Pectin lyase fold/virulence factor n=1 Tax=Pseudocohnilembus persalinus TaxID=266149 RepID=A0A0V0QVG7_PSEPJ|nr:Pectin lyase fold/virulence factor [Pseudocohnilembus persalinus]|eukprot:KRX06177.1 Pectin lyase fold/virulence factor [Pseudocohnilembus persalinus]